MQYWYLWLIFIALCVLTVFVLRKASAALGANNAERERMTAELKRLKELKETFQHASAETVAQAEPMELLEGVNAVLQAKVEKAEDAEKCFETFSKPQQYMYTLLYYLEDSEETPAFFLRHNGEPLLSLAAPTLEAIGEAELSEALFTYFKDQKEKGDVVTDEALQEAYEKVCKAHFDKARILNRAKAYIEAHREEILP